jgi:hypothetical protein
VQAVFDTGVGSSRISTKMQPEHNDSLVAGMK